MLGQGGGPGRALGARPWDRRRQDGAAPASLGVPETPPRPALPGGGGNDGASGPQVFTQQKPPDVSPLKPLRFAHRGERGLRLELPCRGPR